MRRPYTLEFEEAAAIAGGSVAATLTAIVWARPLRTPAATRLFVGGIWAAALSPHLPSLTRALGLGFAPNAVASLEVAATLATAGWILHGSRVVTRAAALGQLALLVMGLLVIDSSFELSAAHLLLDGALFGYNALRNAPPEPAPPPRARGFARDDALLFAATMALAALVADRTFARLVTNGDEIANTFQADVFAHLRAYAPVPPCPSMFENYWVFRYADRLFSQYTPGWPLFMAPFQRVSLVWLAGPAMGGLVAVGVARLSRRLAAGLGADNDQSSPIVRTAGFVGAALAMLGPSMLLNAASRFPHTMVCACFAWSVESLCVVATPGVSRRESAGYGALLGATLALGLATRPADGVLLATGVVAYGVLALGRRRINGVALLSSALAFTAFLGLTAVILRLQLGAWFKTGYSIAPSFHPEAALELSWPGPRHIKDSIPLSTGSYCWWPAAPALGAAGLIEVLRGRERRVALMLTLGSLAHLGFYFFVAFGRGADNGLGPRYLLPLVVPMAVGGARLLAPLFVAAWSSANATYARGPAWLSAAAALVGTLLVVPLLYPFARAEYQAGTAPLLAAQRLGLTNAIVLIEPGQVTANVTNVAQNAPMDPNPDVLFLIRKGAEDDACARAHFPGRAWYRAGKDATLRPF